MLPERASVNPPGMRKERHMNEKPCIKDLKRQSSAELKLRMIAPLVSLDESGADYAIRKRRLISQIAADNCVSERSVGRWLAGYRELGLKGLEPRYPKTRADKKLYVKFDVLLGEAASMRKLSPTISVSEIISCLEQRHPSIIGILKRSTLQQHLAAAGCGRRQLLEEAEADGRAFFGRYRKRHALEQVQGDVKEPPRHCVVDENGLPMVPYVNIWMDNFSRKILTYKVSARQDESIALSSFRELVEKYGVPDTILTDQGSIYRGKSFSRCAHALGVAHKRSKPYRPESKGALERLNGTLDGLFSQIKQMQNLKLSEFEKLLAEWIGEYNAKPHSALAICGPDGSKRPQSPNQAFESDRRNVRLAPREIVESAFTLRQYRKVSKDGAISFRGKIYCVPPAHARSGELVCVSYSVTDKTMGLLAPNTKENIAAGGSSWTLVPLEERTIGPDVCFSKLAKKAGAAAGAKTETSSPAPGGDVPPTVVRLERSICRKEGSYESEDQFMNELKNRLTFRPKALTGEISPYGSCRETGEK